MNLDQAMRDIVSAACRAPSVHNTQPWTWRLGENALELRADQRRRLAVTDPLGRNLIISCGAVLDHAREVASAFGYTAEVTRIPDLAQPDLLAQVRLTRGAVPLDAPLRLAAVADRCTDRRRFTFWPIPTERLVALATTAERPDVAVFALAGVGARIRTELLVNRALDTQRRDPTIAAEAAAWVAHRDRDGIPPDGLAVGPARRGDRGNRFDTRPSAELRSAHVEGSDGLIVIATATDDVLSWLRAGEALSRLWLNAAAAGLSVVPLTQIIEVEETRAALARDVLGASGTPQVLVRIGWQEIGRATLPRTPRRALEEVLTR